MATVGLSSTAFAVDRSWLNSSGGAFQTAANWSGGVVPGAADTAVFDRVSSGYTVNFAGSVVNTALRTGRDRLTLDLAGNSYILNSTSSLAIEVGDTDDYSFNRLTILGGTMSSPGSIRAATGNNATATVEFGAGSAGSFGGVLVATGANSAATFSIASGVVINSNSGHIGWNGGSTGTLLLNSGTWNVGTSLYVGQSGTGLLRAGGFADLSAGSIVIADQPAAAGTFEHNSFTETNAGTVTVGRLGNGTLLLGGGTLTSSFGVIGGGSTSTKFPGAGTVLISGSSSSTRWNNSGNLIIGNAAAGTLLIGDATELVSHGTVNSGDVTIGSHTFGTGFARVQGGQNGAGTWNAASMSVGRLGVGTLEVLNAGRLTTTGVLRVGAEPGGSGFARVDGPDAQLNTGTSAIAVGDAGSGVMQVLNGGSVTSGNVVVAQQDTSTGSLLVSGPGTTWTSSGDIYAGLGGVGHVTVADGATLAANTGSLRVGAFSTLNLDGGTLSAGTFAFSQGAFNFTGGTLRFQNPQNLTNLLAAIGPSLTKGKTLINNSGSLNTTLALRGGNFSGTTLAIEPGGEILFEDTLSVASFTTLTNSGRLRGEGRLNGSVLTNNAGGEVRADASDTLRLAVTTFNNAGQVNLFNGTIDVDGTLNNTAAGRVNGRGVLRANSMNNSGTFAFSGGTSDVFGAIANQSGGKIIVTGGGLASFYDNIANNTGAEVRVSDSSTAVFFGDVTGAGDVSGAGLKIFEFGTSSIARLDTTGSTRVEGGSSLTADRVREHALHVGGHVTVRPGATAETTSRLRSLTIEGGAAPTGRLDLNDNALVIDYDGASPLQAVRAQVISGRGDGTWDGDGITSSLANATTHGLAYAEASALAGVPAIFGAADATSVLVRYTRYGDATLDGVVNLQDFNGLAANFGSANALWTQGDFTYDGLVNLSDFNRLAANFGLSASGPDVTPDDWAALASAVPEPGGALAAGVAGIALSLRRARRSRP